MIVIFLWLKSYNVENYTINDDLSVDVAGDVNLSGMGLSSIPIKFGIVVGNFNCNYNRLSSLESCLISVCGNFNCSYNNLQNLIGCPDMVGSFLCGFNKLDTLKYCPDIISGNFNCGDNKLKESECFLYDCDFSMVIAMLILRIIMLIRILMRS